MTMIRNLTHRNPTENVSADESERSRTPRQQRKNETRTRDYEMRTSQDGYKLIHGRTSKKREADEDQDREREQQREDRATSSNSVPVDPIDLPIADDSDLDSEATINYDSDHNYDYFYSYL